MAGVASRMRDWPLKSARPGELRAAACVRVTCGSRLASPGSSCIPARMSVFTELFSHRMRQLRPSSIREILKVTAQPEIISFAGGLPAPELFPIDAVRASYEYFYGKGLS